MKALAISAVLCAAAISSAQSSCVPPEPQKIVALASGSLIEGVGSTDLPITTKSEKAKVLIRQGYALIHCFWFNEAVRSFRDATKEDPTSGIAWMGLNVALTLPWHNPGAMRAEADYAIRKAVETCGDETDLEQSLIAAFRLRSARVDDRESEFERAMERIIEKYPEANEPRLLISAIRVQLCLGNGYDAQGNLREEMKKVLGWINPVLKRDPKNAGALHYHIHALESTDAAKALPSARQLGLSAPGSSHMVHMPGHIFNRVGLYEEGQKSFEDSKAVDLLYIARMPGATTDANWNYGHNMEYMAANLVEMGRIKDAIATKMYTSNIHWRTGNWGALAGRGGFFTGRAALAAGDLEKAETEASALEQRLSALPAQSGAGFALTQRRVMTVQANELRGALLSKQGRHDEAIGKLRVATSTFKLIAYDEPPHYLRPPHEELGDALISAGRYDEAIAAFKGGLFFRPNSGWLMYGIALAHEKAGRKAEAAAAYKDFLKAWAGADRDLPQIQHALNFK
jgi:tetratricopeptide (TPR) repeat protein